MTKRAAAAWLVFALIVWAPVFPLAWDAAALPGAACLSAAQTMVSRWGVLAATILFAALASACAALLGGLAALACHGRAWGWMRLLVPISAAAAVMPPYLHALAWLPVLSAGGGRIHGSGAWIASWWVTVFAALPLCFIFAAVQLSALQPGLLTSASLWTGGGRVVRQIALPLLRPALAAVAALVYLTSLADFAMPSLFSADPWALAVFSEYSATHDSGLAMLHSLPAILAAAPGALLLVMWLRGIAPRPRNSGEGETRPFPLDGMLIAGLAALGLSLGWLAVSLLAQSAAGASVSGSLRFIEIARSVLSAALGAVLAVAVGAPFGHVLAATPRLFVWLVAALPLALPAPLAGIGLIRVWNQPWGDLVYGTPWMIALASAARFAPVAALLTAAYRMSLDPQPLQSATLYAPPFRAFLRVHLTMFAPGWAAAAALCFALSLGEVSATMPVAPPGATTLALRLYNYLHYGATASVASLALVLAAASAMAGLSLAVLLGRGKSS
jgi:iron(III) transport system permease protein